MIREGSSEIPTQEHAESKEVELKAELQSAEQRLSRVKHPLAPIGESLLVEVCHALLNQNTPLEDTQMLLERMPTMERPHLEYFAEVFEGVPESEKSKITSQLRVIQTTKGCSHRCKHCAIAAAGKVETMPFVTVVKIAEAVKKERESSLRKYTNNRERRLYKICAEEFLGERM